MLEANFQVPESLRENLAFLLRVASERTSAAVDAELARFGLTSRHVAVLQLADGELLNQNSIGASTQTHPNAVITLLDALEEKGLARREQNPANRREYLVRVTPAGKRLLKSLNEASSVAFDRVTEKLTPDERTQLTRLLLKLIEAWI